MSIVLLLSTELLTCFFPAIEDPLLRTDNIPYVACLMCMQPQKLVFCSSASVSQFRRQVNKECLFRH